MLRLNAPTSGAAPTPQPHSQPQSAQADTQKGIVTGIAEPGDTPDGGNVAADPRPRDRWGLFLPQPAKPKPAKPEPQEQSKPDGELGLGRIPGDWPSLPDNASLQTEIAWVAANRVTILESGTPQLDRATSPPPSRSALGWLETSIRAYSKYVDVVARVLAGAQDEQSESRRELLALDEIEQLLTV